PVVGLFHFFQIPVRSLGVRLSRIGGNGVPYPAIVAPTPISQTHPVGRTENPSRIHFEWSQLKGEPMAGSAWPHCRQPTGKPSVLRHPHPNRRPTRTSV